MGSQEITVEQFREFQASVLFNTEFSREENAPINEVTWYQAARYCNWLSQQEGIPEDQWCYDPAQPFSDGMQLYDDYLSRVGYQLPTEAEWEYACRAGTTTARFFGESPTLLPRYAWHVEQSQQRWTLPVASLRPNDFGLFDMLGNVQEWCHNANDLLPLMSSLLEDSAHSGVVRDHDLRRLRGGSFFFPAWILRSAYVHALNPDMRNGITGFRVARTLPALPATDRAAAQGTEAADANIR
jgi:formylglycine-generating enzyme required for sulfatase activity